MEANQAAPDKTASISIPADQPVHTVELKHALGDLPEAEIHIVENEPLGETETVAGTTRFEKICEAGGRLFEKFGMRRGKSQASGPGMDQDASLGADLAQGQAGPGAQAGEPRDPLLVRRSITAVGKAVRKFGDKIIHRKAMEATGDRDYATQLTKETSATDDECEALGEVTDILLKELGIESKYLPLAASLTVVAGCGTRYYLVGKSLNRQIAAKHAKEDLKP